MKIPFDIKYRPQIESGEYKVVTGDNRPVRIISWDKRVVGGRIEIVCLVPASQGDTETVQLYYPNGILISGGSEKFKLFIITPEPELTESKEDEMIRKAIRLVLIATEDDQKDFYSTHRLTRKDCTDWLEKQKEQKSKLRQTLENYKISDEKSTAKMEGRIEGRQDVINNPEEYGLQKPVEWSEEDEGMINCIISTLCEESHGGRETNERMVSWLDKLRKSLHPQLHWKPSEEQMKMLAMFANLRCASRHEANTLESLYNDLKKLM